LKDYFIVDPVALSCKIGGMTSEQQYREAWQALADALSEACEYEGHHELNEVASAVVHHFGEREYGYAVPDLPPKALAAFLKFCTVLRDELTKQPKANQ